MADCKECGAEIILMCQGSTGYCSQKCELIGKPGTMKPSDEIPGSNANYCELLRLLSGWQCCGAPSICGTDCQSSELRDLLSRAYNLIEEIWNTS